MHLKKGILLCLGCLCTVLGAVGAALPLLPTFPFLLLAAFCFARSSDRLNDWLRGTKLYRENIADLAAGRGMTKKAKRRVMTSLSLLMGIGFAVMSCKGAWIGCAALAVVWIVHITIFLFRVKTIDAAAN